MNFHEILALIAAFWDMDLWSIEIYGIFLVSGLWCSLFCNKGFYPLAFWTKIISMSINVTNYQFRPTVKCTIILNEEKNHFCLSMAEERTDGIFSFFCFSKISSGYFHHVLRIFFCISIIFYWFLYQFLSFDIEEWYKIIFSRSLWLSCIILD